MARTTRRNGAAPGRKARGPVVASASRVKGGYQNAEAIRRTRQPWQPRAWQYYDLIGEVHDAGQFVAKGLSGLRLFVEKRNADGTWEELDRDAATGGDDQTAFDLWEQVQDPGGGRTRLNANYGRQRIVAGESYLICTGRDDPTAPTLWEMVSTDELRPSGDGWERHSSPSMKESLADPADDAWDVLPGEVLVFHMWRPHPRYSALADSPLRAMVDTCEQIVLLGQALRNKTRSRLIGAGLFLVPDEVSPPEPSDEEDVDGSIGPVDDSDPNDDPVLSAIAEAIVAPVADETDPSAVVPLMLRVPGETIQQFRLIEFANPSTVYAESAEIEKLVMRLARGFDMPVELLLGIGSANRWNAWMIDRQTWKAHLQSYADEYVTDLTTAYLWQQLIENQVAAFQGYRIGYSEAEIVNNPDRSKDSKDLYDRYVISGDTLRESNGFDDSDAPDEAEIQQRLEIAQAAGTSSTGTSSSSTAGEPTQDSEPAQTASLDAAIDMALIRCREVAGSRVRTRAQKDPIVLAQIDRIPSRNVCVRLGNEDEWLSSQGVTPDRLVAGGTDGLSAWMTQQGYTTRQIAEWCNRVESIAAAQLFTVETP